MSTDPPSPPADLFTPLETLYQLALNLTVLAEGRSTDLDKQIAIEETRKGIIEEAGQILEEIRIFLDEGGNIDLNMNVLEQRRAGLSLLIEQIQSIDQQRTTGFQQEQATLRQDLHQSNLGKQAVAKYQQNLPPEPSDSSEI
jgi:hypothetical protein